METAGIERLFSLLHEEIRTTRDLLVRRLDGLVDKLDDVIDRVKHLDQRVAHLERRHDNHDERLAALEAERGRKTRK